MDANTVYSIHYLIPYEIYQLIYLENNIISGKNEIIGLKVDETEEKLSNENGAAGVI